MFYTKSMNFSRSVAIFALALLLTATPVSAQFTPVDCGGLGISCDEGADAQSFVDVIIDILNFILIIVGVIALAALIWGGVQYIISLGNETGIEKAKKTIIYAIVGLVVVGLSGLIVNFVINLFSGS